MCIDDQSTSVLYASSRREIACVYSLSVLPTGRDTELRRQQEQSMNIEFYGAYWDVDDNAGFIQLRGTDGNVLPNGNLRFADAAQFGAALTVLESSRNAIWTPQAKRIRTGTELVEE